jgi:oligosaccharide repeat unit polymerase
MGDYLLIAGLGVLPFAIGVLARITERSWVAPATLFALIWGAVALPAGLVFPDLPGIRLALVWVLLCTVVVWGGSLAARGASPWGQRTRVSVETARRQLPGLKLLCLGSMAAGFLEIAYLFARQNFSLGMVLSYAALAQVTAANRSDYLSGEVQQALGERLAFLALYCGTLVGGTLFRLRRSRWEGAIGLSPLLLILLVFGLYGSRMGALFGGSFWIGAYLAATILVGNWQDLVAWRFVVRVGSAVAVIGFGSSILTMVWRYSLGGRALNWQTMLGDGLAFVGAFGLWFKDHIGQATGFLWGGRLLRKLVAPLGLDYPIALAIDVGFTSSNVFTVLRDLVEDFGAVGALVFLAGYGIVARRLFVRVARGSTRGLGGLTLVFAFALTSVAFSIFSYTVTAVAMLWFITYCLVAPNLGRAWRPVARRLRPPMAGVRET